MGCLLPHSPPPLFGPFFPGPCIEKLSPIGSGPLRGTALLSLHYCQQSRRTCALRCVSRGRAPHRFGCWGRSRSASERRILNFPATLASSRSPGAKSRTRRAAWSGEHGGAPCAPPPVGCQRPRGTTVGRRGTTGPLAILVYEREAFPAGGAVKSGRVRARRTICRTSPTGKNGARNGDSRAGVDASAICRQQPTTVLNFLFFFFSPRVSMDFTNLVAHLNGTVSTYCSTGSYVHSRRCNRRAWGAEGGGEEEEYDM